MARWLLGVSGGIAAYKALELARLAIKAGHSVRVVQTAASERFVGRASFEAITGAPVLVDEFEADPARGAYPGEPVPDRAPISHLALVQRADLYVIAPASANTLAKLAHGHADNLLTSAALAADCPVLVAPAMNDRMFAHPATAANLAQLAARGVEIIAPGEGSLASHGEYGVGRLAEPDEILAASEARLAAAAPGRQAPSADRQAPSADGGPSADVAGTSPWQGRRVLVTAGGTREPIDSVRYIGNRSSGRMGLALAAAAAQRGAAVTLVAANVALPAPAGVEVVPVATAAELAEACAARFGACDALLMAAAVADFRPVGAAARKLKKDAGVPRLELEPTEDVLAALSSRRRPGQLLVGFAAEHGDRALEYAREKRARKRLDAIVLNDISDPAIGFDVAANEVTVITATGSERHLARADKRRVADGILDEVQALWCSGEEQGHGARVDGVPA